MSQDETVSSRCRRINGGDCVERDSPPPGTFPRKLDRSRQQKAKQPPASHGVFIPADEARDVAVRYV